MSLGSIDGLKLPIEVNGWLLGEDDMLLFAMLSDPVLMPEVMWEDKTNREYSGCFRVRDYQYQINRCEEQQAIFDCARAVGKTVSQQVHAQIHGFTSPSEDMLITAPELIHLLPLTDKIEDSIRESRLLRECLDDSYGRTGFTHRPFGSNFKDGTKLVGRIPKLKGPQPEDARILTPTGWTTMGDVKAGDLVIGSDGKATRVLGVTNSWTSQIYRVEFTDGSSTETDAAHLWTVEAQMANRQLRSTEDIALDIAKPGKHKGKRAKHNGGDGNMWRIPALPLVHFERQPQEVPLDPYVVGALIGDGSISQHTAFFFSWDQEIVDEVERRLPLGCALSQRANRPTNYWIKGPGGKGEPNPVVRALRELGLMGHKSHTKFIPDRYKYGSPQERLDVLRGILDTDGTVKDSGGASLISASARLVDDVVEVARSLGGWASSGVESRVEPRELLLRQGVYQHKGGTYFRATVRIKGLNPFLLPRKVVKYQTGGKQRHKSIRAVVPSGEKTVRCIKVEARDGLYVTDEFIVTHNTGVVAQHAPFVMVEECFPAGTLILTDKGLQPIETIVVGERVLTHKNRWRRVTAVAKRKRQTCVIKGQGHVGLEASLQHPFWCVQQTGRGSRSTHGHQRRLFGEPEFVAAQNLAPAVGYPKDDKIRLGAWYWGSPREFPALPIPDLPLDDDLAFWFLVGVYLAEGCVTERGDQLTLSLHRDEIDDIAEFLTDLGLTYSVFPEKDSLSGRITLTGAVSVARWFSEHLGRKGDEKHIPAWLLGAPEAVRRAVLDGYLWGDGHEAKDPRYAPGRFLASCAPKLLTLSVRLLAQSLGYGVSIGLVEPPETAIRGRVLNSKPWHQLRLTTRSYGQVVDHLQFTQVKSVVPTGEAKTLYDLTVEEDHSFVAEGFVVSNSQFFPEPGWNNLNEVINYDAVDKNGKPRWRYWCFGVHDGNRTSGFSEKAKDEKWTNIKVTRLMRGDWGKDAKERAKSQYGGTSSPDYRRNILGEPGDAASAFFVTARLLSCVDQRVERGEVKGSAYNTKEYLHQLFRAEELEDVGVQIGDALDLPHGYESIYGGVDVGLNRSPTVISLFTEKMVDRKMRLQLFRRFTLERFRSKQIRQALYAIDLHYGGALMSMGVDSTGLGLPLLQELEDDEICPPHLMQVIRGYFFNQKVPVGVAPENVYKDDAGVIRDQYGRMLEEQRLPDGSVRFVVYAPFITASTRYLAEWVDSGYLMFPFDKEITTDMLGETKERVDRLERRAEQSGGAIRKPDIFHILDSFRAMAMSYHATDIEEALAVPQQRPVLDQAF